MKFPNNSRHPRSFVRFGADEPASRFPPRTVAAGEPDDGSGPGFGSQTLTKPVEKTKTRTKTPSLYRVLLLNDDYTPMDFVIHVLQKFFQKEYNEATRIMLQVHQQGAGVAGVFTFEIAETKVFQVSQYSKQRQYPLKCTMEKT